MCLIISFFFFTQFNGMERDGKIHGFRSDPNDNRFGTYIYPWAKKFPKQQPSHILEQDFKISMYPVQKCPPQRCSGQKCPQKHPPQNRPPQNRPPQKCPPQKYLTQNILLRNILLRYAYQDFSIFRRRLPITGNYVIFLCNGYPQSCQIYPKYWIFIAKISLLSYKN